MSRIAKQPVIVPNGVTITLSEDMLVAKGPKGEFKQSLHPLVKVLHSDDKITFEAVNSSKPARAMSGTMRMLVSNTVEGVHKGFEKKLILKGVGYRAKLQGKTLNLTLGFSHPVNHAVPEGITIECPSQTEVIVKGVNKQLVGQVAADIRAYRPPEPYKGKGVRYDNEEIILKETKKK